MLVRDPAERVSNQPIRHRSGPPLLTAAVALPLLMVLLPLVASAAADSTDQAPRAATAPDTPIGRARTCAGVRFPPEATVAGARLPLLGVGLREVTAFGIDVYVAALYVDAGVFDEHLPVRDGRLVANAGPILASLPRMRLVLRFLRGVDREQLTASFAEGIGRWATDPAALKADLDRMNGWMRDMSEGDTLAFVYEPLAAASLTRAEVRPGLSVEVRGVVQGSIPSSDFARAFFTDWLGAQPPSHALREGLLGGACG